MLHRALLIATAALLCIAAAPARHPAKPPAKPADAAHAAKKASEGSMFDATDPDGLLGLLAAAGVKTQTTRHEADALFVALSSPAADFSVQFAGCGSAGKGCRAVLFDGAIDAGRPSLAQVNGFNQSSLLCRIYEDKGATPHVMFSIPLARSLTSADATNALAAWQGCLADGLAFVRDPVGYLANAA